MRDTDEIQVPIIEITDGWTVDEIETEDDCDDAFAVLTAMVVGIEARMDDLAIEGQELSVAYKRCKSALRWKKAGLSVIGIKRGKINRAKKEAREDDRNKRVIDYFYAMHPEEMKAATRHVDAGTDKTATPNPQEKDT
jgi:hypothetical protein